MANSWTLCDTHCHIHDDDYPLPADEVLQSAADSAVGRILTMGSDLTSEVYKSLEHKNTTLSNTLGREAALQIIRETLYTYECHFCGRME